MTALLESLAVAYAGGISLYATVALLGIAQRLHWVAPLPGTLQHLQSPWIIGAAVVLAIIEIVASLVPGIASAWETVHTFIRPPAAALLAVATTWGGNDTVVILAALLGGTLALGTHGAKLGVRYAIDTSPEPFTNAGATVAELGVVSAIVVELWRHPVAVLVGALVLLVVIAMVLRAVWRAVVGKKP